MNKAVKLFTISFSLFTILSADPIYKSAQTQVYKKGDDGSYKSGINAVYVRDDTKQIVEEKILGYIWQDDSDANSLTKTWDEATLYCDALSLGGYDDWRLPSKKELKGLVDYGRYNPSIDSLFKNISSDSYWSSTTSANNSDNAWYVYFYIGSMSNYDKSYTAFVRCVRGG